MKLKKQAFFWTLILAAGLLLAACSGTAAAQSAATLAPVTATGGSVTATGHLEPISHTDLYFQGTGRVSAIRVKEGDAVKKGDLLISLGDREGAVAAISAAELGVATAQRQLDDLKQNAALAKAQAQANLSAAQGALIQAEQALTDLNTNDYATRLDAARTAVVKANEDLVTAQSDFDKVSDLAADNPLRKTAETKLKDMQKVYDTAVHTRDTLINQLDMPRHRWP